MEKHTTLFQQMWSRGQAPQDTKVTCSPDYRSEISLLNIAGKNLARTLLTRLYDHLEQELLPPKKPLWILTKPQQEFQDKHKEMLTYLYTTFVDLKKAFNRVNRDGRWRIMQKETVLRILHT
ncbi:unnamed protein product [Schistocephalus solidus]|uniref:Reverse transcriptase domain-containing protein n=1 Tax=Schistocephalus solidus TaxID=70667 RepID=A0A183T3M7_SCHSO|nr:unnamed protein product [Schistocephalus solidus]